MGLMVRAVIHAIVVVVGILLPVASRAVWSHIATSTHVCRVCGGAGDAGVAIARLVLVVVAFGVLVRAVVIVGVELVWHGVLGKHVAFLGGISLAAAEEASKEATGLAAAGARGVVVLRARAVALFLLVVASQSKLHKDGEDEEDAREGVSFFFSLFPFDFVIIESRDRETYIAIMATARDALCSLQAVWKLGSLVKPLCDSTVLDDWPLPKGVSRTPVQLLAPFLLAMAT